MKQHTDWVKSRIQSVTNFAEKTFVTAAPRDATGKLPAAPYVVIHPADGVDTQERYTGPRATQNPRFTLHIVGRDYDSIAAVTRNVKAKFIENGFGVVPVIDGEKCRKVWWESPGVPEPDTDVTPQIAYGIVELGFTSDPA